MTSKTFAALSVATALAIPSAALAEGGTTDPAKNAAVACKQMRSDMTSAIFKATFGTNKNKSNAFGKCVSRQTKTEKTNLSNASKDCKAERDSMGKDAFNGKYATNKKKTNGFGKCVSGKAKAQSDEQVEAKVNAAKTCKDERAQDPAAFKEKWGTNKNKKNAFGKCVSATAKKPYELPAS